jgi:hypothetical protein
VPGPQKYESKTLINGSGIIFNSKFRSSPGKTISGKNKLLENKLKSIINLYYFSTWTWSIQIIF